MTPATAAAPALRHSVTPPLPSPPAGWLPLSEAALHLGVSRDTAWRQCQAGKLAGVQALGPGGRAWYVDPEAIPALHLICAGPPLVTPECTEILARMPATKRNGIRRRLAAVSAYREALAKGDLGPSAVKIAAAFVAAWNGCGWTPHLTTRTLRRWERHYESGGVQALVDERRWHGEIKWSPEAMEFIEGLWLREGSQALQAHYERAAALAPREGWKLPTYRHVCRLMARLDRKLRAAGRDPREFRDRCLPYALRDGSRVPAMQCWVADHRLFDVLLPCEVRSEKTGKLVWRWRRPWLTMFLDYRSWMPAAWSISFECPDGNRTMATFIHGVRVHGKPGHVYIDNGKDFRMARFSGGRPRYQPGKSDYGQIVDAEHVRSVLDLLGVGCTFALPFNAKAKVIEPWFKIAAEKFDRTWDTYCGESTERKPEELKGALAKGAENSAVKGGLTLEAFSAAFSGWINGNYGLRESPAKAAKPLSALRAFEELREPDFIPTRPSDEDLSMLLLPSKPVCVGANGLSVAIRGDDGLISSRTYWHDALEDRRASSGRDLRRKVTYRYDPDDLSRVWVFDATTGQYLCEARPYIGEACHPLAKSDADLGRVGAVMALRRGLEKRTLAEVRAKRAASTNLLLSSAAGAARHLGILDDPATIPDPPPPVLQMTEVSAAARDRGGRDKPPLASGGRSDKPPLASGGRRDAVAKWQSDEVTEKTDVGASAIDELPDVPAAETEKEHAHDSTLGDDWPG